MPDLRTHRGEHPDDARDFRLERAPVLRCAVAELSYLLTRGYAQAAALKLVGDHHQLTSRQRRAVARGACADEACEARRARRLDPARLCDGTIALDGFNCLITVEALLAGAPVFVGRDGALRDLASVHGTYRRVEETERAVALVIAELMRLGVRMLHALLDRPVGNSGRLRALLEEGCRAAALAADVRLTDRVDRELVALGVPVASSDSWILERAAWVDLPALIGQREALFGWRIELGERAETAP